MKNTQEREQAVRELLEDLQAGATVYCNLKKRARSGMSREIQFFTIRDNQPRFLTYWIAKLLGHRMNKQSDALRISGTGMDMGFHVVDSLSYTLYGKGGQLTHRWI